MKAQVRPGRFRLAWFVAGIAVVPLSVVAIALFGMAIDALNLRIASSFFPDVWMPFLALFWVVNGCCIGILQKAIVKRYLRVDLGRWTVYTALGAMLAGLVAYPCLDGACLTAQYYELRPYSYVISTVEISIIVLVYLTVLSAAQCLALNHHANKTWQWVAAHVGSLSLAALALVAAQILLGAVYLDALLTMALFALSVTAVTGIVMQRLLTANRNSAKGVNEDWAYQPATIRSELPSARSVWDEAI